MELTWDELRTTPVGTILHDEMDEGLRFIIMRGPGALCAYIGVPDNHPMAGINYNDMPSISCHGGLTYSGQGGNAQWPEGYWWYGWDYAHCGDYAFFYDEYPLDIKEKHSHNDERKWLVKDVKEDAWSAIYDFKKLMKFSETQFNKQK